MSCPSAFAERLAWLAGWLLGSFKWQLQVSLPKQFFPLAASSFSSQTTFSRGSFKFLFPNNFFAWQLQVALPKQVFRVAAPSFFSQTSFSRGSFKLLFPNKFFAWQFQVSFPKQVFRVAALVDPINRHTQVTIQTSHPHPGARSTALAVWSLPIHHHSCSQEVDHWGSPRSGSSKRRIRTGGPVPCALCALCPLCLPLFFLCLSQ